MIEDELREEVYAQHPEHRTRDFQPDSLSDETQTDTVAALNHSPHPLKLHSDMKAEDKAELIGRVLLILH
jgi:hypothetical protein